MIRCSTNLRKEAVLRLIQNIVDILDEALGNAKELVAQITSPFGNEFQGKMCNFEINKYSYLNVKFIIQQDKTYT